MSRVLIVYSTTDGQTRRICERLKSVIEDGGDRVELAPIAEAQAVDLQRFDKVVVGASIRYGRHQRCVGDFVAHHAQALQQRPSAFFSVNVVARKPDKNRPETNPYLREFLGSVPWRPTAAEVFAGRVDYPRYGRFDRMMIRLIMWLTKGPTDPHACVEFTDWGRVEAFGRTIRTLA